MEKRNKNLRYYYKYNINKAQKVKSFFPNKIQTLNKDFIKIVF